MKWLRRIFRKFGIKLVRLPGTRSRGACPVCGRDVARKKDGSYFGHDCKPLPLFEALEGGKGGAA